uniref:Uncharacterized protein n=1 Tax=Candidatus Kentrum sp. DK TaxID=2126562 RepID=A0A450TKS5_9GAMM|nr:MAG: hypothetical protein BECKDK2373B_GA0170837_12076 [Candidatus Kentron sp. DK]
MLNDILIDHTSIHSVFSKKAYSPRVSVFQVREVLKIIESLLLPKRIWVANFVSRNTWDLTEKFFGYLNDSHLANPVDGGDVRSVLFSHEQKKKICRYAAPNIYQIVSQWKIDSVANDTSLSYKVRPDGADSLNFVALSNISYDSDESKDLIDKYTDAGGWGNTASLFLMNHDLLVWLKIITQKFPDPNHVIYSHLNTLARWQLNESTASAVANEVDGQVYYMPAYGRGLSIENSIQESWNVSQERISQRMSEKAWLDERVRSLIAGFVPTSKTSFPMFGLWVLSKIRKETDINDLLDLIKELRGHSFVRKFNKWDGIDKKEIDVIVNEGNRSLPPRL